MESVLFIFFLATIFQAVSLSVAFLLGYYIDKQRMEKSIEHKVEKAKEMGRKIKPSFQKSAVSINLKRHEH